MQKAIVEEVENIDEIININKRKRQIKEEFNEEEQYYENLQKNDYAKDFREKIQRIEKNKGNNTFLSDYEKNNIKNLRLTKKIETLDDSIQTKIYFTTMRNYWRKTSLETIYRPFWYSYKENLDKEFGKVYFENIHFLHLDFNTLPENKKWIMGCQCSFCKDYVKDNNEIPLYITEKEFITENLKLREYHSLEINYWNTYTINDFRIYDYLYGLFDEEGYIDLTEYDTE
jgi:hypothetical protein